MFKLKFSIVAIILFGSITANAQIKGFSDDFDDNILSCNWKDDPTQPGTYTLSEHDGKLEVNVNQTSTKPSFFWVDFGQTLDISSNSAPQMSFVIYSDSSFSYVGGIDSNAGFSDPTIIYLFSA